MESNSEEESRRLSQLGFQIVFGNSQKDRKAGSLPLFEEALNLDPNNEDALAGIAACDDEQRRELIEKALQINPNNINAIFVKANMLFKEEKYKESLDWCDKGLRINPTFWPLVFEKTLNFSKLKLNEMALEWADKCLEINPDHSASIGIKAVLLGNLGKYNESIEWSERAIKSDPSDPVPRYYMAGALKNQGKYPESLDRIEESIELNNTKNEYIDFRDRLLKEQPSLIQHIKKKEELFKLRQDPDGIVWGSMLGRGAFGAVFACTFEGSEYAGKRVTLSGSKDIQDLLLTEISIMERFSHPNVISLKRKLIREKEIIILMPRFNSSLEAELDVRSSKSSFFTVNEILDIEGLNHIHSSGVAHRDLKTANCLVNMTDGKITSVCICDFGISKRVDLSTANTFAGTFQWMAPEIYKASLTSNSNMKYDAKQADIWSLGCILYSLITLSKPYSNISTLKQDNSISRGTRPSFESDQQAISFLQNDPQWPKLLQLYERCTVLEPKERPTVKQISNYLRGSEDLPNTSPIKSKQQIEEEMSQLKKQLDEAVGNLEAERMAQLAIQIKTLKIQLDAIV